MTSEEAYWEAWLRSTAKSEQRKNASDGHGSCPPDLRNRLAQEYSIAALARLADAGRPRAVASIWDLDSRELVDADVEALGSAFATAPEYATRVKLLFLIGRSSSPSQIAFSNLRDHFWRIDPESDPPENSERYMCWSFAAEHAIEDRIGDLVDAAQATRHGSSRSPAVLALARFPAQADLFRTCVRDCLRDASVAPAAAEVLAKIRDVDAIPLLEHSLDKFAGDSVHPEAFRERLSRAIKLLDAQKARGAKRP